MKFLYPKNKTHKLIFEILLLSTREKNREDFWRRLCIVSLYLKRKTKYPDNLDIRRLLAGYLEDIREKSWFPKDIQRLPVSGKNPGIGFCARLSQPTWPTNKCISAKQTRRTVFGLNCREIVMKLCWQQACLFSSSSKDFILHDLILICLVN